MAKFRAELDTSNLTAIMHELARMTGKDYQDVVKSETQSVLTAAVRNTPVMDTSLLDRTRHPNRKAVALAAKGLLKKVWVQIGDRLGMNVDAPQYVHQAATPKGDYPEDAQAKTITSEAAGRSFIIEGTTYRYYDPRLFSALAKAVNGRVSFFRMNLRRGVFDHVEKIAAKYKGLYVDRNG
jgi:hypothetical protein